MYNNEMDDVSKEEMEMLIKFSEELLEALCDVAIAMDERISFKKSISEVNVNRNNRPCIISSYNDGTVAAPVLYPDELYGQYLAGSSIEEIAHQQYNRVSQGRNFGLDNFNPQNISHENLAENLFFQVINRNLNPEIIKSCPYVDVADDLIAIPRYNIGTIDGSTASFAFTYKNLEYYKITKEEVFEICRKNNDLTEFSVKGMTETLVDIWRSQGVPEESIDGMMQTMPDEMMYVITDHTCMNGSAALLNDQVLQEIAKKFGHSQSCLIIPSSRMELIAVPDTIPAEEVLEMVKSVNEEVLTQRDYLSTNVYRYDKNSHELKACFDREGKIIDYNQEIIQHEHMERNVMRRAI